MDRNINIDGINFNLGQVVVFPVKKYPAHNDVDYYKDTNGDWQEKITRIDTQIYRTRIVEIIVDNAEQEKCLGNVNENSVLTFENEKYKSKSTINYVFENQNKSEVLQTNFSSSKKMKN
jgi:hypothetical protein